MSSDIGQYETTTNTSQLIRWLLVCSAANLSGRPMRGHPSPAGAPPEPEGASPLLEIGWSHLLLTASKLKPCLLCPVGGTLQSQLSICPCSGAKGCFPTAWICPLVPPQFILVRGPGGFHLDEHAGRQLGLCKRMSAWPSGCLVSKKIGSGLNQQWRWKFPSCGQKGQLQSTCSPASSKARLSRRYVGKGD